MAGSDEEEYRVFIWGGGTVRYVSHLRNENFSLNVLVVIPVDSDTLAAIAPDLGLLPNITVTGAEDMSAVSGFTRGTASSRQSARAGSGDCTVEPEHLEHFESPPAYTP